MSMGDILDVACTFVLWYLILHFIKKNHLLFGSESFQ
jgi:hypothetical protein